jgi:multiple sugar transport system permease protein
MTSATGRPTVTAVENASRASRTDRPGRATRRRRLTPRQHVGRIVLYVVLIIIALVYIAPFYVDVINSFKTDEAASTSPLSLPTTWTVAAFRQLFGASNFPLWALNSVIISLFVTVGRIFFDSLAGYALARLRFRGRGFVNAVVIGVMAVPSVALLIPRFLIVNELGIFNTYQGLILPLLVDAAGVFIMKNFFDSIPESVEEQARIDGAGTFRVFWSIVLPMARPALVTIAILSFQGSWNEYVQILVSSNSPQLYTLTKGVASLASGSLSAGNQFPIKLAGAFVMTIPVAIAFFVFQRRIMNSSEGAVKE